jgi:hypothetical protein
LEDQVGRRRIKELDVVDINVVGAVPLWNRKAASTEAMRSTGSAAAVIGVIIGAKTPNGTGWRVADAVIQSVDRPFLSASCATAAAKVVRPQPRSATTNTPAPDRWSTVARLNCSVRPKGADLRAIAVIGCCFR